MQDCGIGPILSKGVGVTKKQADADSDVSFFLTKFKEKLNQLYAVLSFQNELLLLFLTISDYLS